MHSKTENLWWNVWLVRIHCSSVTSRGTVLRSSAVTIGTSHWVVPINPVSQSHTGLHDRPIESSTHELAELSSLFSAFRKCLKLQNWYHNVLCYIGPTTFYGSAAGCRSMQKTCAFWKHGLTFENTQSQLTYFCKSNINQTFTNSSGMIWGVMIAIFTEIRHLVEELITFLSFFCGPQKLGILTARQNKSLSISTSNSMRGD